jgi:hypothetical protein
LKFQRFLQPEAARHVATHVSMINVRMNRAYRRISVNASGVLDLLVLYERFAGPGRSFQSLYDNLFQVAAGVVRYDLAVLAYNPDRR